MPDREPHHRTLVTLDKLDSVKWFSRVGRHDLEMSIVLNSWGEAIEKASSADWQDLILQAANHLRDSIMNKNRSRFLEWNKIVQSVRPFARGLVSDKVKENNFPEKLSEDISRLSNWNIIHLCMECEFLDIVEPGFFHAVAFYYKRGAFLADLKAVSPKENRLYSDAAFERA